MTRRERDAILAELTPSHTVDSPVVLGAPFVLCSPHSGRHYPSVLLEASRLDPLALRKSEDCLVDELFAGAASLGAPLIAARFPRAYLDVNREPYELDPQLFIERPPAYANTQSLRVAGGLGTIARIVSESEEIYLRRLPISVAFERIDRLYKPFHEELARLIERTRSVFGHAILIDCHSMPSASMSQPGSGPRPDIVIGDRFGASCHARLTRMARELLVQQGFQVQLNRPYAGGFITEHYGRPSTGVQALQIEINRALYIDEATLAPHAGFVRLQQALTQFLDRLFREWTDLIKPRAAAE
ncbi:MAG: N-formylglutamate amidohydrolase [Hyphomicrobiaceae bacterium]